MIIVLHFNHADMPGRGDVSLLIAAGSYRFYLMQFTEALCCAVNVFALITGYFPDTYKRFVYCVFLGKFQIANNYATLEFPRLFSFTLFTTVSMYVVCPAVAAAYKLVFQNTLEKQILKRPIYRENLDKEKGLCTQNCRAYSLKAS